jgi:Sap, sulfolipid-1-addressing protein
MWSTVVLFGLAVNFEPNRLGLIALILTRRRPAAQLALFLGTAFAISSVVGLLVLFVFHHGLSGLISLNGPALQLGIGIAVLALATVLAIKPSALPSARRLEARKGDGETAPASAHRQRRVDQLATQVRDAAQSESRWFTTVAGAGIAMPTVEYMALLALIIGSNTSPFSQAAALFTFLILGSLVGLIPIAGYLIAPDKTREKVQRLTLWIRSRQRRDVVVLLAIIGAALVVTGATHL